MLVVSLESILVDGKVFRSLGVLKTVTIMNLQKLIFLYTPEVH